MAKYIPVTLNFIPNDTTPKVFVHQGDFGSLRQIKAKLYHDTDEFIFDEDISLTGYLIYAVYRTEDGTETKEEITSYTASGNEFAFPISKAMTAKAGSTIMSILFSSTANNISTQNFELFVEPSPKV